MPGIVTSIIRKPSPFIVQDAGGNQLIATGLSGDVRVIGTLVGSSGFSFGTMGSPNQFVYNAATGGVGVGSDKTVGLSPLGSYGNLDVRSVSWSNYAEIYCGNQATGSSQDASVHIYGGVNGSGITISQSGGGGNIIASPVNPLAYGDSLIRHTFGNYLAGSVDHLYLTGGSNNDAGGIALGFYQQGGFSSAFKGLKIGAVTTEPTARVDINLDGIPSIPALTAGVSVTGTYSAGFAGFQASVVGVTNTSPKGTGLSVAPTFNNATGPHYGAYIAPITNSTTATMYGLYVSTAGATAGNTTKYAASFMGGNVGVGTSIPGATFHSIGSTIVGGLSNTTVPATMGNSQVNMWINESGNALSFQVKYSTGVIKSGTVSLT